VKSGRVRFSPGMNRWFYSVFGVLFLSGVLWLVAHSLTRHDEFGERRLPVETWLLKTHGAAAMASLVVLGVLLPLHVQRAWEHRRNRMTGALMATTSLLLVASGYGLYYSGSEELRPWVSGVHSVAGCLLPFALIWHIASGRKRRRVSELRARTAQPLDSLERGVNNELAGLPTVSRFVARRTAARGEDRDALLTHQTHPLP